MSKLEITAVSATVMLAVSSVLLTKVVELTVTPPGLVVPVTNHLRFRSVLEALAGDFDVEVDRALFCRRRVGSGDLNLTLGV